MFRLRGYDGLRFAALLLAAVSVGIARPNQHKVEKAPVEGKEWFTMYCAPCHGDDAKGHGPAARGLKEPPADLTTLAKRNKGKFPADYVKRVLTHGITVPAHGPSDMPVWGPTFTDINARNLIQYLESVQEK
jgi:mono/diheme cytochrome c family protein